MPENRYFIVATSPTLQATIAIDGNKKVRVLDCTNHEFCYYSNIIRDGKCPLYCQLVVEAKKYAFGRREPKANVREIGEPDLNRFVGLERLPLID